MNEKPRFRLNVSLHIEGMWWVEALNDLADDMVSNYYKEHHKLMYTPIL